MKKRIKENRIAKKRKYKRPFRYQSSQRALRSSTQHAGILSLICGLTALVYKVIRKIGGDRIVAAYRNKLRREDPGEQSQ